MFKGDSDSFILPLAAYAESLARQAGEVLISERKNQSFSLDYKRGVELVTTADLAADALIRAGIESVYPDHNILSEESAPDFSDPQALMGPLWVIDPIDGTVNFANQQPAVAVSIAFAVDGVTQVGVVHCPFMKETFTAVRGRGAFCNGQPIKAAHITELRQALVATGFPYEKEGVPHLLQRLQQVMAKVQDVRRMGSAAIDICYVAAGRLGAYYETVNPWDMAAGYLIAREAGAQVGRFAKAKSLMPEELNGEHLLVASPPLFEPLQQILEPTL
ncbi:inositol phosphatase [Pokkaliibacter plantistimulans]|uniref:Inositol-1-monophosphatase n=1 Tax=Pokkaliibacter plantistimulans TaxID=1635171 RepID=A0ABX5M0Z7_9GAMM|nr:inositol monophosphatase family protein [Pokkaliibacter plantistimulans]PXF32069.1 inositol phosphatase [Pokkaliibacter plantistimulans]